MPDQQTDVQNIQIVDAVVPSVIHTHIARPFKHLLLI